MVTQLEMNLGDVPLSPTLTDMELAAQRIRLIKDEIERMDAEYERLNENLSVESGKFIDMLRSAGKESYKSDVGTATIGYRTSVRLPDNDADREAFFQWLRDRGIYESTVGVHSSKLKSLYEAELEAARNRGEGMDFVIPGIKNVTTTEWLSFRRK